VARSSDPAEINSPLAVEPNADYVDQLYQQWLEDPPSVSRDWQIFFQGFRLADVPATAVVSDDSYLQSKVASLIFAYRSSGHLIAQLDPLGNNLTKHPHLALEAFDLGEEHLDTVFDTGHLGGPQKAKLREIIAILKETYCRTVGAEYIHIQDREIRRWLQARMEPGRNRPNFSRERKLEILKLLIDAESFELFLQQRYPGQKRFSLEGAESTIPGFHALLELAPELGIEELVVGMAHRGRLNVLANILDKPYSMIFSEFEGNFIPESVGGDGDVKYHLGYSSDHVNRLGHVLHLSLTSNPSHLEAVDPVVQGRARGKQVLHDDTEERRKVVPFLIHGDAAFSGQGLVAETLNLSQLKGYRTGGTVHLIINNQIGFTTLPPESRSTLYSTDVAKMIEAPIFHVNGDDPEAVAMVLELALEFRQEFHKDVVVDMICYRRHGHNESDEPAFTQPQLYAKIKDRPPVRRLYEEQLRAAGELSGAESEQLAIRFRDQLQKALDETREKNPELEVHAFGHRWTGLNNPYDHRPVQTGVDHWLLMDVARALTTVPVGFVLNPKVARKLPLQLQAIDQRETVDWAFAELLALGSMLHEGMPVRLSGQDSARGTFSQRHAVWSDVVTCENRIPLMHIHPRQARFCVYNSLLSEAAVLGFEHGYSRVDPRMLVIWEAQFGDFANGAQVIIDQFIVSSQSKWQRTSGLVMLLPHGYEGQGPEHSNAYLERYLAACAEDNIQACNMTTPAQYFHALRRQQYRPFRLPLIVMSPKSLLRHPRAVSPVSELIHGWFHELLDEAAEAGPFNRLVFCSGKVYYDLLEQKEKDGLDNVALVRVEQLYPWPAEQWAEIARRYGGVDEVIWAQEEPANRGGWSFMFPRLYELFGRRVIRYAGRAASASPAVGSLKIHRREQEELVSRALTGNWT
jgi:2-oxoglutarate dehydrogenase E1 component